MLLPVDFTVGDIAVVQTLSDFGLRAGLLLLKIIVFPSIEVFRVESNQNRYIGITLYLVPFEIVYYAVDTDNKPCEVPILEHVHN